MADTTLIGGDDDFGPFTGYEIVGGLVCLGWDLIPPQNASEVPELRKDSIGSSLHINWEERHIEWDKRPFMVLGELMVAYDVKGRKAFGTAALQNALDLLDAVRRFKAKKRGHSSPR